MATLSPPTMTTTAHTPFLPKSPQLYSFKKSTQTLHSSCTKVSCNASNKNNNDDHFQLIQNPKNNSPLSFDRRNMLFGLGGMYGAAMTLGGEATNTLAAPIAPDIDKCTLTNAEFDKSVGDRCCPPAFGLRKIEEFKFEDKPVMRTRRPAHLAMKDEKWLADYKRGIALMKSLPLSDPRNFMQQARVHCAYCDGAYPVLDHSDLRYEVHGSWLFAPFHRWYLYFFEKILGKLVDNPEFALPYWNWDHPDGMRIPEMFKDIDSPLYNPNRNKDHLNAVVDLSYTGKNDQVYPEEKQIEQNLLLMRKQMLYPTKASVFFGDAYRSGDTADANKGAGALELAPHNHMHIWTGSKTTWANQDMGAFWSAGRDSIFYCHHANVDRMWSVWRNDLPGRSRLDINDPDYLNAYFILYDEDANPKKVYVRDCLDTEKLGYKYEEQELPWLFKTVPKPPPRPEPTPGPTANFPKTLDSVLKTSVKRPKKSRTKAEIEAAEEVLVISMDIAMSSQAIKYDVFINEITDPKPADKTDVKPQFAGSFSTLGHRGGGDGGMAGMTRKTEYKVALSSLLEDIGASDDEFLQVTLVPKVGGKNVVINDIKIELVTE